MYLSNKVFTAMFKDTEANKAAICQGFKLIAEGMIAKGGSYTWNNEADKDDAVSHAVITCLENMDKCDVSRNSSAFAYFSQVSKHAIHYHLKRMKRNQMDSLDLKLEDRRIDDEFNTRGYGNRRRAEAYHAY